MFLMLPAWRHPSGGRLDWLVGDPGECHTAPVKLLMQRFLDILKDEYPSCNRRYKSHSVFFVVIFHVMGKLRADNNRGGGPGVTNKGGRFIEN